MAYVMCIHCRVKHRWMLQHRHWNRCYTNSRDSKNLYVNKGYSSGIRMELHIEYVGYVICHTANET